MIIWFKGLSGSGKTTLATGIQKLLELNGTPSINLDGDVLRSGLCSDLGFSRDERRENIRRTAFIAKMFENVGFIPIVSLISPFNEDIEFAKDITKSDAFVLVYIKCPISICEKRDPKGLYEKNRKTPIHNFTGVTDPFEEPFLPDITVESHLETIEDSLNKIYNRINSIKKKQL